MVCEMDLGVVSIVVPAYNSEKYIKDCVDSILRSTYKNIEVIVVNDGSTDGTKDIIENNYSNKSQVKLINKTNGGVSHARNVGLDLAQGEYVMFVDSDDMIYSNTIEILLKYMHANAADVASGCYIQQLNFSDDLESANQNLDINIDVWEGKTSLQRALEDHPATYSACAKLYKRNLISDTHFIEGKRAHEDSFFVFEILLKCPKMIVLDIPVYKYRINSDSASRAVFSDKFFDILFFAEEKEKLVIKYYPEFMYLTGNLKVKANMALLGKLCKTFDKKYIEDEKKAIRAVISNRKSFIPAIESDKKFFYIIICRLYWIYKVYLSFRSAL